jgi:hypothetical protein
MVWLFAKMKWIGFLPNSFKTVKSQGTSFDTDLPNKAIVHVDCN